MSFAIGSTTVRRFAAVGFRPAVAFVRRPIVAQQQQHIIAAFSTSQPAQKSVIENVKSGAKVVDRTVSDKLVDTITVAEKVAHKAKAVSEDIFSSDAARKAAEVRDEATDKASELAGRAKQAGNQAASKASEVAGEAKKAGHETSGQVAAKASEAVGKAKQTSNQQSGQASGKASELTGKAKGAASEAAGKVKGTAEEVKGKM